MGGKKKDVVDAAEVARLCEELLSRHVELEPDDLRRVVAGDVAQATDALEAGRLVEAVLAVAWALWLEPGHGGHLALLDRILAEGARRKVELPPRGAEPEPLFTAIHAHAAWSEGDRQDALELLSEAALLDDDLPFAAAWLPRWLDDDAALVELGADEVIERLGPIVNDAAHARVEGELEPARGTRLLALAWRVVRTLGLDPLELPALSDLLIDALAADGRGDESLALARAAQERRGDLAAQKALAVALQRAGQADEAVTWYLRAHEGEPDDPGCLLDAAELRLDQERWRDALDLYERVLALAPHPWATPSAHFCRWRLGDQVALDALQACARTEATAGGELERLAEALAQGKRPQQAVEDLMAMLSPHPPGQERDRARALLGRIPGESVEPG